MALPCQKNCSRFYEGCHKTCESWKALQLSQAEKREREKALRHAYLELYAQLERQWRKAAYCPRW